jgi:hypothetical protein
VVGEITSSVVSSLALLPQPAHSDHYDREQNERGDHLAPRGRQARGVELEQMHVFRLGENPAGAMTTLDPMRHTSFRHRMAEEFGEVRSEMLAQDHVLSSLGGRTVDEALEAGMDPKQVWLAICEAFEVPAERR